MKIQKFRQTVEENTGIDEEVGLPGFDPDDTIYDAQHIANTMQEPLAIWILKNFPDAKSILDIGCAAGALGYYLRKLKPELTVVDLDGNKDTINSSFIQEDHHFIVRTDQPYNIVDAEGLQAKFDLILSFEHLEHIQEETFDLFTQNVVNHSKEGTTFFGTAAMWRDSNRPDVHCHMKSKTEWDEYFLNKGWEKLEHPVMTRAFKSEAWDSRMRGSHEVRFVVKVDD